MKYYHYLNFVFFLSFLLNYHRILVFIYFVLTWIVCVLVFFFGNLIHVSGLKIQSGLKETKSSHSYFTLLCEIFDM